MSDDIEETPEEAPKLTEREKHQVEKVAKRAGEVAAAEKARELMPYSDQPPNIQKVAAWLLTVKGLEEFHKRTLHHGSSERVMSSVELWWGAQMRGKTLQGGVIHAMFSPDDLGGNFKDCVLRITRAFCNYTQSDEIHEIRGQNWALRAPSVAVSGGAQVERTFAYKQERGVFGDQIRQVRDLGYLFTKDKEGRRDDEERRLNDQLAIKVAAALGHSRAIRDARDEAYEQTRDDETKRLLDDEKRPRSRIRPSRPWRDR
jgi:hypothetical protein